MTTIHEAIEFLTQRAIKQLAEVERHIQQKKHRKKLTITASEIKALRQRTGLTQGEIAKRLLISPRTWEGWEQGTKKPNQQAILLLRMLQTDKKATYALVEKVKEQS